MKKGRGKVKSQSFRILLRLEDKQGCLQTLPDLAVPDAQILQKASGISAPRRAAFDFSSCHGTLLPVVFCFQ